MSAGHTEGHQSVKINSENSVITLIGDSPFTYEWLWTLVPDDLWKSFRTGEGSRFFWQERLSQKLYDWVDNQPLYNCPESGTPGEMPHNADKEEIKIFSHDPGLIGKNIL